MVRTVMLRIDATATQASWQRIENGQLAGSFHTGRLADAFRHCAGANVIVLVPAEDIFITRMALPGKNRKKLLQAVPYAVEDQLVDDIENLHFALSPSPINGQYIVAAVEDRLMKYWDSALKAAGIHAETMLPDVMALSASQESWSVLLESARGLVRTPGGVLSSEMENLPFMLNNLYQLAEHKPADITVYDCSRGSHFTALKALCTDLELTPVECANGSFAVFARHYDAKSSINLLQGSYNRQKGFGRHFKHWGTAAVLFSVWIGWQLAVNISAIFELDSRSETLSEKMQSVYKQAFPGDKPPPVGYERSSMESKLKKLLANQGQGAGSVQEVLVKTAPLLKNVTGAEIEGFRYNNGKFDVDMTVQGSGDVETLKTRIEEQTGWEVKTTVSTSKGVTKVRLTIISAS